MSGETTRTIRPMLRQRKLTKRQVETLQAIRAHIKEWGMPPTRIQLARTLGVKSDSTATAHLAALERRGYVELLPGQDRGIRLLREGTPILALDDIAKGATGNATTPQAPAATTRMASIDAVWLRFEHTPDYLVVVDGDSMNRVGLKSGDMVAVRKNPDPREGEVVIARTGSNVTLRRYHRTEAGRIELRPESTNPEHKTLHVDPDNEDFEIAGVVVGAIIGPPGSETDIRA